MPKSSMKNALGASLGAESDAFKARLARADAALGEVSTDDASSTKPSERVVREAFTLPEIEHAQIAGLRQQMLGAGVHVTKSEVVRAGLLLLGELDADALQHAFERVEKIKVGRPKTG